MFLVVLPTYQPPHGESARDDEGYDREGGGAGIGFSNLGHGRKKSSRPRPRANSLAASRQAARRVTIQAASVQESVRRGPTTVGPSEEHSDEVAGESGHDPVGRVAHPVRAAQQLVPANQLLPQRRRPG